MVPDAPITNPAAAGALAPVPAPAAVLLVRLFDVGIDDDPPRGGHTILAFSTTPTARLIGASKKCVEVAKNDGCVGVGVGVGTGGGGAVIVLVRHIPASSCHVHSWG